MMKLPFPGRIGTTAAIMSTAIVVVALAVMQYRWNQEASEATSVRLADSLQLSMINWHLDLFRNLSEVALTMKMPDADRQGSSYAGRLEEWRSVARYRELVKNIYVVRRMSPGQVEVEQMAPGVRSLRSSDWPAAVGQVVDHLDSVSATSADTAPQAPQLSESFYNIGSALRLWRFDPAAPALVRATPSRAEWLVVELDERVLRERILPDLAQRYFQGTDGLDYQVAVVSGGRERHVIYTSDSHFGDQDVSDADGRMDVFGRARSGSGATVSVFHKTSENRGPTAAEGVSWFPLLGQTPVEDDWQLVVRHRREGPLGSFVAQMRQRGLIVSITALCVLVLSLTMLMVTTVRAQRLARLQMDFVTTVSHELRTPLTIIGSAADNLASGVIEGADQLREYGTVISHQVGQLSGLVERILRFAAARDGRQTYVLEPLRPSDIVDSVLTGTHDLIQAAQFVVDCDVSPDLPAVVGDRMAVSQCLENLVTNALKYGKDGRWVGIQGAFVSPNNGGGNMVEISVSDRGIGIDPEDMGRIFEPFYRSRAARVTQLHGTGLGLAVAKQIAESLGGELSVRSVLGEGSTFTLRLPRANAHKAGSSANGSI